jgi:hypothetical protein
MKGELSSNFGKALFLAAMMMWWVLWRIVEKMLDQSMPLKLPTAKKMAVLWRRFSSVVHSRMSKQDKLRLYRNILRAAVRFPSITRVGMVRDIKVCDTDTMLLFVVCVFLVSLFIIFLFQTTQKYPPKSSNFTRMLQKQTKSKYPSN